MSQRLRLYLLRGAVAALVSASAATAAPELRLEYEGTFSDVSFAGGKRTVSQQRVELLIPAPSIRGVSSPGPAGIIRVSGGGSKLEYQVRNAYQSTDKTVYLATNGKSALVLLMPGRTPNPNATNADIPAAGQLLFSDRDTARDVTGTLHIVIPPRKRP